jgi:hypothetical protein
LKRDGLVQAWSLPIGTFARPVVRLSIDTDPRLPNFNRAAYEQAYNKVAEALGGTPFDIFGAV